MTQAEMRQATGLGPEWWMVWVGPLTLAALEHRCWELIRLGATHQNAIVRLAFSATETPGIEAATCERCKIAWVRAMNP